MATVARLLSGLVIVKLVAWYGGPGGVGRLGQFLSLVSLLAVFGGGGIGTGIVKYISEYRERTSELTRLAGAALTFTIGTALTISGVVLLFSPSITVYLLEEAQFKGVILLVAAVLPFIAANNYIISIINGYIDLRRVAIVYIATSLITIILAILLTLYLQVKGALVALVLGQGSAFLVSFPLFCRAPYFTFDLLMPRFDGEMALRLTRYSIMSLTSAVLPPLVHIWVRDHLAAQFSWEAVGYWQATTKVSEAYLLFFTMPIGIYYLPKLSAIDDKRRFKQEVMMAFGQIMPIVTIAAALVYFLRDWITVILFSADFGTANTLYGPQLLGDVLKIASFILSYIMLAKAMTFLFLASELVFSASYVGLVYILTSWFGLVGAVYAFTINYAIYLAFTLIVVVRYLRGNSLRS